MRKSRGFRLGRKVVKLLKWIIPTARRNRARYHRLERPAGSRKSFNPVPKILAVGRSLRRGAKGLCLPNRRLNHARVEQDPTETTKPAGVPKGYSAVYVGNSDDDTQRYLVPVIYFNHPLFGELLQEAERVHGFNHPGGITIPCGVSEFERVKTTIAAGEHRPRRQWMRPHHCCSGTYKWSNP